MTITNFDKLKLMQQQQARASQNLPKMPSDFSNKTNNQLLSSHYRDPQEADLTRRTPAMIKATRPPARPQAAAQNGSGSQSTASSKQSQRRQEPATMIQQGQQAAAAAAESQQQQEVWTSTEDLFWDHMREVQNKWNTLKLNDDIWAKLIYFEQNRRLAKAYVSTPVLTIDGSTNGLDGFRIGLSGIENSYRNLDSIACLRSIGHGIKLKIDHQGNILIRKLAPMASTQSAGGQSCSIWIKEWPSSSSASASSRRHRGNSAHNGSGSSSSSSGASDYSHLSSASDHENWPMQEISDCDTSYKLFDMQRFRFQLERSRSEASSKALGSRSTPIDWRQCVSIISFVRARTAASRPSGQASTRSSQQKQVLAGPCWLMLINIIAIDMLKSSVCDTRPSPVAQTSALVNKVANSSSAQTNHESPRTLKTAKKLPISGQVGDEQQQLNTSDYATRRLEDPHAGHAAMKLPGRNYQTNCSQPNSSQRLNKSPRPQAAQPKQPSLSAAKQQPAGGPISMMTDNQGQRHYRSSQQLDGSIYTTFTGKYLDKQQRLRTAQEQQQRHDHLLSSIDDLSLQRSHQASRVGLAPADRCHESHHLYPVESLIPALNMQRIGSQLVQSGRSSNERQPLLHSLSAFDLSHGLKLNLRSVNSTSIKMNFDSEEEEENENEILEEDLPRDEETEDGLHEQREDLIKKLKLNGLSNKSLSKSAGRDREDSGSRWASLAKYALNESSSSKSHYDEEAAPSSGIKSLESSQDSAELSSKLRQQTSEKHQVDVAANAHQQSRSSIATTSSNSSGCADNDYFVSQSSNSSMSSASTRGSHEAEELSSQPASSSGIICSGNTSDETTNPNNQGQRASGAEPNTRAKKCSVNVTAGQHQANATHKRQQVNKKQSVSLNRCYNIKTVDFSQEQAQDSTNCGHCSRASNQAPQQLPPIQCDCGAVENSTCDQMLDLDQRHHSDLHPHNHLAASACDCCCDCLAYPNGGTPFSGSCEDELCYCGALDHHSNHHGGDEAPALGEEEEEPIYDQLPRFGRQSPQSNQLAKFSKNKTSNRTKIRTSRRTSEERLDVTNEEDYDRIVPVPMPSDGDLHKLDKSKKARFGSKELRRNSGWLESRKYIKLFPRFMFASSSSSSSPTSTFTSSSSGHHDNKSGTLDRAQQAAENKFRRSRSSQNLSKYFK